MKFDLQALFGKKHGEEKPHKERVVSPRHDWKVLLSIFTCVIVLLLAVNIKIFTDVNKGEFFVPGGNAGAEIERLDRAAIDAVIVDFEADAREHAKLRASKPVFPDPSNR